MLALPVISSAHQQIAPADNHSCPACHRDCPNPPTLNRFPVASANSCRIRSLAPSADAEYAKFTPNFFRIRSYAKSLRKPFRIRFYEKHPGVWGLASFRPRFPRVTSHESQVTQVQLLAASLSPKRRRHPLFSMPYSLFPRNTPGATPISAHCEGSTARPKPSFEFRPGRTTPGNPLRSRCIGARMGTLRRHRTAVPGV